MKYHDKEHMALIKKIDDLWSNLKDLSDMAAEYGIADIFQDNGAKTLQQLIYLNLKALPGREGNDAISMSGKEWEMKSINLSTSASGFSTNHHTNQAIINKYRQVLWAFSIYHGINLDEIYIMTPQMLEPIFSHWEDMLRNETHINNPKISVQFVRHNGVKVYPFDKNNPIDPDSII